jgi:hypothetical protein
MQLSEAVKQVGSEENIEAAFLRLYGSQVKPEHFRQVFNAVRSVPQEMIDKIQEHAALTPEEAFRKCCPEYVDVGQFMTAVLESRKPQAEQSTEDEGDN